MAIKVSAEVFSDFRDAAQTVHVVRIVTSEEEIVIVASNEPERVSVFKKFGGVTDRGNDFHKDCELL